MRKGLIGAVKGKEDFFYLMVSEQLGLSSGSGAAVVHIMVDRKQRVTRARDQNQGPRTTLKSPPLLLL